MEQPRHVIDGNNFATLEGFFDEIAGALIPGQRWGRNLQAFDDILAWPAIKPYTLVWRHHRRSRRFLNYTAMADVWRERADSVRSARDRLEMAERGEGPTLFDYLIEILQRQRNKPRVDLRLE